MSMTLQGVKHGIAITPVTTVGNTGITGLAIDTSGYDELQIQVAATQVVASNKFTLLKLISSETSGGTYTDVSGYIGGTDFTIPDADASNPYVSVFNVDLRGKKRFAKIQLTTNLAVTQNVAGIYILSRASVTPSPSTATASGAGANTLVNP